MRDLLYRLRFRFPGVPLSIFKERPGVISEDACWVCWHNDGLIYLYTADTLLGLARKIRRSWKNDSCLVG